MDAKPSHKELQEILQGLKRLYEAGMRDFNSKKAQQAKLDQELTDLFTANQNLAGSIKAIGRALGLPLETKSAAAPTPVAAGQTEALDATTAVMLIVANHHETGGVDINRIEDLLKRKGFAISREYLHTILNRKKNHQKKLTKIDSKWFLTDKGQVEVRMRSNQ